VPEGEECRKYDGRKERAPLIILSVKESKKLQPIRGRQRHKHVLGARLHWGGLLASQIQLIRKKHRRLE